MVSPQQDTLPPFRQRREPPASPLEFDDGSAPRNTGYASSNSKMCWLLGSTGSEHSLRGRFSKTTLVLVPENTRPLQLASPVCQEQTCVSLGLFVLSRSTSKPGCGHKVPHRADGRAGRLTHLPNRLPPQNRLGVSLTPAVACHLKIRLHVT